MKTRVLATVLVALAVLGAIFGYRIMTIRRLVAAQSKMVRPPTVVSATAAEQQAWPNTLSAVGTLASFRGITVKTELEGTVRRIEFESGATVPEGALLVELDTSVESAQLAGLEAQARLAELNANRARELRLNKTNSQADLDLAEATLAQNRAAVDQMRATLAKKRIVAPFAGRLGIARVYPGQFLSKGDAIVQLETLDPIYVDFALPQQDLGAVTVGQPIRFHTDAQSGRTFEGRIVAVNPRVSDSTRTLQVRASLANADECLRPGMFGQVEVVLPQSESVVVLPTAAIVYNPYGNAVFVIEKGVAHQRFVQTGAQRGSLVAVRSGVKPGEQVVTSGQIKLRNGSPVEVNNAVTPSANPAPKPNEG